MSDPVFNPRLDPVQLDPDPQPWLWERRRTCRARPIIFIENYLSIGTGREHINSFDVNT